MSKLYNIGLFGIGEGIKNLVNGVMRGIYALYFGFIKIIAWVLDMLTQLFFIFSGMTPVSSTSASSKDGTFPEEDIVNFFLTQNSFRKAYVYLCLVALGLVVVFAIAKIIKQDYFDRAGPRSKGPIFRNIALSFVAFICIIPIFAVLIDIAAALALLVMSAMGYRGGGIGTTIFNLCWEDGGEAVRSVGRMVGTSVSGYTDISKDLSIYFPTVDENTIRIASSSSFDRDNFGWYSVDTFYVFYWDVKEGVLNRNRAGGMLYEAPEFYWYMFIFTGLILIVNLGQMMLAMLTRIFNLIALFIVSPSPISQIVLDDGAKFKAWKDKVVQEALKVVGCVMSFMPIAIHKRISSNQVH